MSVSNKNTPGIKNGPLARDARISRLALMEGWLREKSFTGTHLRMQLMSEKTATESWSIG